MLIAKRYQDDLTKIKGNIKKSYDYFKPNYDSYHYYRKLVFDTSISDYERGLLNALGKPILEFNMMEAYISRLRGEFSKQEPSVNVEAQNGKPTDPAQIALVEGYFRSVLADANKDSFEYNIYTDLLSGGFSVIKVWTEYAHEMSMDQVIKMGRVFDPTLCGFDINTTKPHKADGMYSFENFPKTVEEFKSEFGSKFKIDDLRFTKNQEGFSWSYQNNSDDILIVSDYYEKKKKEAKIVQLVNNQVMTVDDYEKLLERWRNAGIIEQPPAVKGKARKTLIETICRYRLIENQVIDYEETDYKYLPLIFVDGNSVMLRDSANGAVRQKTRPYIYHVKDTQRLVNFAGQSHANDLENQIQKNWKVPVEGIPDQPEYVDALTNNQMPGIIPYKAFTDGDDPKPIPPPQEVVRQPAPPETLNTFMSGGQLFQTILGSYDASLGINNNQLSGVAIVEGATQSNAAAMPYVVGFLQGLTQAAVVVLDLMPKYLTTDRTIPIVRPDGKRAYVPINQPGGIFLNYESTSLNVCVEAGVNFAIQKSRALQQIISLCQASPLFAQFINQMGLEILLDNLEIRGIDQLKQMAKVFMQQLQAHQQAAMNQPNPVAMKTQLEMQKFQHQVTQDQAENQFRTAQILNDANENTNNRLKIMMEQQQAGVDANVQMTKAKAETYSKAVELALKANDQAHTQKLEIHDQLHRHGKDVVNTINDTVGLIHSLKPAESNNQTQITGEL